MRQLVLFALVALGVALLPILHEHYGRGRNIYATDPPVDQNTCSGDTRIAVIGDYGVSRQPEADVAALVAQWRPQTVVTVGDNNYPDGAANTIDANIGRYFSAYIGDYKGNFGPGAAQNAFFPALGNHDYRTDGGQPYLDYFTLPGDERTYEVRRGPVHLFILDSNSGNPNGRIPTSPQAAWLRDSLAASDAVWKLVIMHHPPYSSGDKHGDNIELQWDYAGWGATAVLAGHEHLYERLAVDGIPYFVNGLGGQSIYPFTTPRPGSVARYNQDYGAMLLTAGETCLNFGFINRRQELIDNLLLTAEELPVPTGTTTATPESTSSSTSTASPTPTLSPTPNPSPLPVATPTLAATLEPSKTFVHLPAILAGK